MRELNLVELNAVNGAIRMPSLPGLPQSVSQYLPMLGASTLIIAVGAAAAYFGYHYYNQNYNQNDEQSIA